LATREPIIFSVLVSPATHNIEPSVFMTLKKRSYDLIENLEHLRKERNTREAEKEIYI
jgi:hypothetical protein